MQHESHTDTDGAQADAEPAAEHAHAPGSGEFWSVADADYHKAHRDSNGRILCGSTIELFLRNKLEFAKVTAGDVPPAQPSKAMQLGSLVHCALLEPELFMNKYACAPFGDGRTKEVKDIKAELRAAGKTVIDRDTWAQCMLMVAVVLQSEIAGAYVSEKI